MPTADVYFFAEEDNVAPALVWLQTLNQKVRDKFIRAIELLGAEGATLQRPTAAPLRDKIYELRVRHKHVNLRLLYFFHGKSVAILCHGCTKESEVDDADIEHAIRCKKKYEADPDGHAYREEE